MQHDTPPVFRFAPSPNGLLHLGHAHSALLNQKICRKMAGRYLLRLEDIDQTRCTPQLESQMLEDLRWLGIEWEEPVRRQSEHFADYAAALEKLRRMGLVYPSFMTRGEIKRAVAELEVQGDTWPRDPDGSPHYPGPERDWSVEQGDAMRHSKAKHAWRLDMKRALEQVGEALTWWEADLGGAGQRQPIPATPEAWGDVILARSDTPTSYHLAVTVDDALQGVTHVVRGRDLYEATSVHRLLQKLLGLSEPVYHHHDLVIDDDGRKLSKSDGDVSLKALRQNGVEAAEIERFFRFSTP
ncbi:MAG: tRNA glutamyl-Q(34) synthetase GluQRS [Rhizobiaceae bacterium]|nr:tRNA glutamyl-Q(34) synthetase GluQRS [Rhizobiaceae bacterium]